MVRINRRVAPLLAGIALAGLAVACSTNLESTSTASPEPVINVASAPTPVSTPTVFPTATAHSAIAPEPQPSRLPKSTVAPLPTALPELLTDAEQILALTLTNMRNANSYRAQVTHAWIAPVAGPGHGREEDLFMHTELEVGPGQRGFVATAIEMRGTDRYELIHIDGIKYERQIEPSISEWSEIGRERALVAMGALTGSLRFFKNPELADTRAENGIMVYELTGNYWNGASGPPLIREGYESRSFDSITVLISTETLLPVSISVEHGRNLIDRTTAEVIRYGTSVIEATINDYGQVEVNVVHPRVPIPTLGPVIPTVTATSSPTPTRTPRR